MRCVNKFFSETTGVVHCGRVLRVTTRFSGLEVVYNEYCTYDVLYISVMFM